jgi:hypothetical protein
MVDPSNHEERVPLTDPLASLVVTEEDNEGPTNILSA